MDMTTALSIMEQFPLDKMIEWPDGAEDQLHEALMFLRQHHPDYMEYPTYLNSRLWKKIRRRVLKRDNNMCFRCGRNASQVHHRSYAQEVMRGEDDAKLAGLCAACHGYISKDENGQRRSESEQERLLLTKPDPNQVLPIKLKLVQWNGERLKAAIYPRGDYSEEALERWVNQARAERIKYFTTGPRRHFPFDLLRNAEENGSGIINPKGEKETRVRNLSLPPTPSTPA